VGLPSWSAWLVAVGFPAYFVSSRKWRIDHLGGLWFDMALTIPVAIWGVVEPSSVAQVFSEAPRLFLLIGLLGYVEPVPTRAVSLLLEESVQPDEGFTYVPIWAAVILLVVDGALHLEVKTEQA
jgi:chloramphenicol-sensitive protein RarD